MQMGPRQSSLSMTVRGIVWATRIFEIVVQNHRIGQGKDHRRLWMRCARCTACDGVFPDIQIAMTTSVRLVSHVEKHGAFPPRPAKAWALPHTIQ